MNMIYNASAGTGKTWQVTELYCALVLGKEHEHLSGSRNPVDPEEILLMTFTDNAAAELRAKVSEKMIAAERDALQASDDDRADRARRVLRKMPAANISTIHAFCAGLLREHALEIGLSPGFQTLEEEEREALLDDVLKTELFQILEKDSNLRDFCSGISVLSGDYSLLSTVRSLLEKAASRGLDLFDAEARLPPSRRTVSRGDFESIRDELTAFGATQKTALKALDALEALLADEFLNPLRVELVPKFGAVKKVKHLSDALADLKERFLAEYYYEQNIETFRAFARCLSCCASSFSDAKRARDAVDFGDLLLFARDLLNNKSSGAPAFKWIIVDEVQDTSRVQCDLIESLWEPQTNLVVCGDRKQSIYAWRSADPQVMPDLEAAMARRGGYKQIDLKKSYRSKDRVIDAVNELFEEIYDSYDALEPLSAQPGEKPCVEFLTAGDEESGTEEEMTAVARRIRLLVDGGGEWRPVFGYNGKQFVEDEPFRYGDILILLKRSTHQAALEKALRTAGIPYTSGGKGRALFEQYEVRDLLLFLQVITQPENDLALVGFLRSPFAKVPDETIVELGWNGETFDHETLRKQFFESGSSSAERILRYRRQVGENLPSHLVRELVRETAFDEQLAGEAGGEQMLANFKKALDWLRAAERGGQMLIGDVVRRFEKYIQSPPRSGAAEALLPDPQQNAVTLMTVHGAKGLTKRGCFVPDISFGDVNEPGFAMLSAAGRLEMNLAGLAGEKVKTPGWTSAREADKSVRKLEKNNLFYVAMTRARDLVVLSGAGTKKPNGWLKQADGFLEGAAPEILRTLSFDEVPEVKARGWTTEDRGQRSEIRHEPLNIPKGPERKPVTELLKRDSSFIAHQPSISNSPLPGTLGHMILEELAKNRWDGDIPMLVKQFGGEGDLGETELLTGRLEVARNVLRTETAGAEALFAEYPFVLKRGDVILDGTIDLLVQFSDDPVAPKPSGEGRWKIFDYKFSKDSSETALKIYSPQLMAYREAVERLNPGANVSAALVLIGETVQLVQLGDER